MLITATNPEPPHRNPPAPGERNSSFDQLGYELENSLQFKAPVDRCGICLESQTAEEKPLEEKSPGDSSSMLPPYLQNTTTGLDIRVAGKGLKCPAPIDML